MDQDLLRFTQPISKKKKIQTNQKKKTKKPNIVGHEYKIYKNKKKWRILAPEKHY